MGTEANGATPRSRINSFDDLDDQIENGDGVTTVTMEELRDAYGVGKLGVLVRKGISEKLRSRGLGHLPQSLPAYQEESARVYRVGSPVGRLLEAAQKPGVDNDEILREAAGGEAADLLRQIRELVCV